MNDFFIYKYEIFNFKIKFKENLKCMLIIIYVPSWAYK